MTDWYYWKSMGVCPTCHRRKPMPGHVQCWQCTQTRRLQYAARKDKLHERYRTPEHRAYASAWMKQHYWERKSKGMCVRCGKRKQEVGIYCRDCWNRRKKCRKQTMRAANKSDHSVRHNLPAPPPDPKVPEKVRRQIGAIIALYNAGWTISEISQEVRLSTKTVWKYVHKAKEMQDAEKSEKVRALEERSV